MQEPRPQIPLLRLVSGAVALNKLLAADDVHAVVKTAAETRGCLIVGGEFPLPAFQSVARRDREVHQGGKRCLTAPPVEDPRHERDADDGEHQEDEQTQRNDAAQTGDRTDAGLDEDLQLRQTIQRSQRSQDTKEPEEAQISSRQGRQLNEGRAHHDEVEDVPCVAEVGFLAHDKSPGKNLQAALDREDDREHVVSDDADDVVRHVVVLPALQRSRVVLASPVLFKRHEDTVDHDAEQDE
mmetsp:Transcript_14990/g.44931  ORF Transcript_14990/g.44931 Transcript_14990/m.44931 type:complete len:240 (+) Transcript_14990:5216-5935(+)